MGIQQCPTYFTLVEDSAVTKIPIHVSRGIGVVWSAQLVWQTSNINRHIPTTVTIYSSRLMTCPNCSCLIQLGAQIEIQNTSPSIAVDLLVKRLDVVRLPINRQSLRYIPVQDDICEPLTYYILMKVHIGDTVSKETFWKVTI